jgi:quercetin dioxygenase-like cupin family protein
VLEILRVDEAQAGPPPEPENFIGRVRMQNLARLGGATSVEALAVFFDPGARTRPHVHQTDQVLHFVRGSGFVVFPGEERQLMPEGSVTIVPAATLHMHGATEEGPVCQLSLLAPDRTDDWDPPVPDEWRQYAQSQ